MTSTPLACIEHLNVTVSDPDALAGLLCDLFGWKVRWSGPAKDNGYTVHVGSEDRYLALYTHNDAENTELNHFSIGAVNHIGLVVDDLENMEQRIIDHDLDIKYQRDYGVCKSIYFMADKQLEIEIIGYER